MRSTYSKNILWEGVWHVCERMGKAYIMEQEVGQDSMEYF